MHDERAFTPHAEPGWLSWDSYSPEAEFCTFVGVLQRMLQPAVLLETGVGVGRLTSHLDLVRCTYLGFESDSRWRVPPSNQPEATPSPEQLQAADFVVLDSAPGYRLGEIAGWAEHGKPGSVCVVHDCANNHPEGWAHWDIRQAVEDTGLPGVFLKNPRGGWLGVHS